MDEVSKATTQKSYVYEGRNERKKEINMLPNFIRNKLLNLIILQKSYHKKEQLKFYLVNKQVSQLNKPKTIENTIQLRVKFD